MTGVLLYMIVSSEATSNSVPVSVSSPRSRSIASERSSGVKVRTLPRRTLVRGTTLKAPSPRTSPIVQWQLAPSW